jgi:hypothetical protein
LCGPIGWAALGLAVAATGTKIGTWAYNKEDNNIIQNF